MIASLWRKDWKARPIEQYPSTCSNCRRSTEFTRLVATQHVYLLGVQLRRTGLDRHLVQCRRCGFEHHVRDLVELDSPVLADLYARSLRAAVASLGIADDDLERRAAADAVLEPFDLQSASPTSPPLASDAPERLDADLLELRDTVNSSVSERWIAALSFVSAAGSRPPVGRDRVIDLGERLLIPRHRLDSIVTGASAGGATT